MNLRRILLVDTAERDRPNGSMVRYRDMVRRALESCGRGEFRVEQLDLAPSRAWLAHFPEKLRTPIRYLSIAVNARRRWPRTGDVLAHLLDGSHAYLLGAVKEFRVPLVVTLHDLIPALCLNGELAGAPPGVVGGRIVRRAVANLRRADGLVADSGNTRADAIRIAGIEPERIRVVHPAVTIGAGAVPSPSSPAAPPYILHVAGNNTFYKNRAGVVDIFRRIRAELPVRLQLAGAPPDAALRRAIEASGVAEAIDLLPEVTDEGLATLYRGAAFLLFPSLYEGFGWPPLEAMAHGCPVVCSDAGSLPEITGAAALSARADDPGALAEHGLRLLRDPALRQHLAEAGWRQTRRFSPEAFGTGLLAAYEAAEENFRARTAERGGAAL